MLPDADDLLEEEKKKLPIEEKVEKPGPLALSKEQETDREQ
jgi:hypothetical protein